MAPIAPLQDRSVSLLGCGWLGLPLAEKLISRGFLVRGSTTRPDKLPVLSSLGIEATLMRLEPIEPGEWNDDAATAKFFTSRVLVLTIPPQAAFGETYFSSLIESLLARRKTADFEHLVFISSTSVYGARQGRVDETSPLEPDSENGRILVAIEEQLRLASREMEFALTIVRPGGLIGPGRHPGLFLAGRKGVKDPSSPVNLIHQLDCAEAIAELVDRAKPTTPAIYNLVSNSHPKRSEFYSWASMALGMEAPTFEAVHATSANKLVVADKIREFVKFRFDDLEASLLAKVQR